MQYDEAAAKAGLYTLLDQVEALYDDVLDTRGQRGDLPTFGYKFDERLLMVGVGPNVSSFFSASDAAKLMLQPLDTREQMRLFAVLEGDRVNLQADDLGLALHDLYTGFLAMLDNQGYRFALITPTVANLPPTVIATHIDHQPHLVMLHCERHPHAETTTCH